MKSWFSLVLLVISISLSYAYSPSKLFHLGSKVTLSKAQPSLMNYPTLSKRVDGLKLQSMKRNNEDSVTSSFPISSGLFESPSAKPFTSSLSYALPVIITGSFLVLHPSLVSALEDSTRLPPTWIAPTKSFVGTFLNVSSFAFLCRIVLSWYPQVNLNKFPTNLLAWPTEPFLKVTRSAVPPAFGVDVSPIIWVAFLSFLNEILVSNQGILTILESK